MFARLQRPLGSDEHNKIVKVLAGKVPLVIDDIDKARPTAYGAENVFVAIDSRVSNLIPLIVTTNLDLDELAQHWPEPYGEAIVSRLAGYCRHVRLTGHDRRIAA
jgi:DNA replication protein DnaC